MDAGTKTKTKDVAPRTGEMIKPGEIIGIPGLEGWSLADRRTWNMLLTNAWGSRLEDPTAEFEIALHELRGLHDSNDRVRASLRKLQRTLIECRLADGSPLEVQMLGFTNIKDANRDEGRLRYDFHRKLVPILRSSDIYARMEIKVLASFVSKYSLALYESIALRINLRRTVEEIDLQTLRHWLGVETGKLDRYADFNRKAIVPAVAEVNALSPYDVSIEPVKQGKTVVAVRVTWAKKEPFSPAEQAAAREVNRPKAGRSARLAGQVESLVRELTAEQIQKGFEAAVGATGIRIDKYAAHSDWLALVRGFPTPPSNPVGHFIDFCKKRAKEIA